MGMFRGPRSPYQGRLSELEAALAGVKHENAELRRENENLKSDNERLGGGNAGAGVQMRRCVNCSRDLPDGPGFFPGYLKPMGKDSAAEAARHHCFYCQ
jgi:hypothetical protein